MSQTLLLERIDAIDFARLGFSATIRTLTLPGADISLRNFDSDDASDSCRSRHLEGRALGPDDVK